MSRNTAAAPARESASRPLERPVGQLRQIPVAQLVEAPWNARSDFGSQAELEASIREEGLLNPLIARPSPGAEGLDVESYEVFCGHRRLRAAKALGLEALPVIVRPCGDQEARSLAIVDNLQREGLGPMDEARAFGELQRLGLGEAEIAARCVPERSNGPAYVHTRLALLELPGDAQDLVRSGELPLTVATAILRLAPPLRADGVRKVRAAMKAGAHGGRTAADLVQTLEAELMLPLKAAQFDTDDASLAPRGACGSCAFRTGNQAALFGTFEGDDVCTDSECYRAKLAETFRRKVQVAQKRGLEVLTGKAAAAAFPYKQNPRLLAHDFVKVDDQVWVGSGQVSVKAALAHAGEKAPKVALVQSPHDGSIHEVVSRKALEKAAQGLQRSKATRARSGDDSALSKAEREAQLRRRQEELRARIDQETLAAVAEAVGAAAAKSWAGIALKPAQAKQLQALARAAMQGQLWADDEGVHQVAKRRGWLKDDAPGVEKAFNAHVAKLSTAEALGLVAELHVWGGGVFAAKADGPAVELIRTLGVDPKAIRAQVEKRVREEQKAHEAAAAPAKGAAKAATKGKRRAA